MNHTHCPTCGRKFARKQAQTTVNTAEMTDAELYAHFKKTAPVEDLAFFLRNLGPEISPELRAHAEAITAPTKADMSRLRCAWRRERNLEDQRLADRPAAIPNWPKWQGPISKTQQESEAA